MIFYLSFIVQTQSQSFSGGLISNCKHLLEKTLLGLSQILDNFENTSEAFSKSFSKYSFNHSSNSFFILSFKLLVFQLNPKSS
jgi:hypothetical protein